MIGLSIEHRDMWYIPEFDIHPIGDYSESKQKYICEEFGVNSIDELKPGMEYTNEPGIIITIVDIND